MFKSLIFTNREDALSLPDFHPPWLRDQSTTSHRLPGLQRAVFNLVRGDGADGYDGISELWFDSEPPYPGSPADPVAEMIERKRSQRLANRRPRG